jgi:hypothetical protein
MARYFGSHPADMYYLDLTNALGMDSSQVREAIESGVTWPDFFKKLIAGGGQQELPSPPPKVKESRPSHSSK